MSFKKYQQEVDEWVQQFTVPYWHPLENLARLTEEMGELARELNHKFGPKKKKATENTQEMGDEIADIIFTLICLANSNGIDLDESFDRIMEKSRTRDHNRYERKDGK